MKERSYEKTFGSRYQEGEERLQDNIVVSNACREGYMYGMGPNGLSQWHTAMSICIFSK